MASRVSPRLQLLVGIVFSLIFLALALRGIDFSQLLSELSKASLALTLPAQLLLLVAAFYLKAWRWALILRPLGAFRIHQCLPAVLVGFMGNNIYPAHLGEPLRAYVFARHVDRPFAAIFSTLVVERVFDLVSILIYFSISALVLGNDSLPDWMIKGAWALGTVTVVAVIGAIPFVLSPDLALAISQKILFRLLPESLAKRLQAFVEDVTRGLAMARNPALLLACMAISLVHWLFYGAMMVFALEGLGLHLSPARALFLQGTTAMAVVVPASPGFFGLIQFAFDKTLGLFPPSSLLAKPESLGGLAKDELARAVREKVIAASMYYHFVQYVPVTIAGLLSLKALGGSVSGAEDLQSELAAVSESKQASPPDEREEEAS